MNRRSLVVANWKMNGNLALVQAKVNELRYFNLATNVNVVICPSFPYLAAFAQELYKDEHNGIYLGAQNVSEYSEGAHTGDVSAQSLQEMSVEYVIVGHSERRNYYKESSLQVAHKVRASLNAELIPILCIGESNKERVNGHTKSRLAEQLQPVIDEVGIASFNNIVIAYEPVWAIGTGKTASAAMAQETHQFIRQYLALIDEEIANKVPLLYGGSVNSTNCHELFAQTDIDGSLVGGASLKVDEFKMICSAAKGT